MLEQLKEIEKTALAALSGVQDEVALEQWRVASLGRSSALMQVFTVLGTLPKEQRPLVGQQANEVKKALEAAFALKTEELNQASLRRSLEQDKLDVTLPGRRVPMGRLHPDTQILRELYRVFAEMGFQVYRSREVESDEYNFQLLNFPIGHPARDMQDTYFIEAEGRGDNPIVLRTHTSPGRSAPCVRCRRGTRKIHHRCASSYRAWCTATNRWMRATRRNSTSWRDLRSARASPSAT